METYTAHAGLINFEPGVTYPVNSLYRLADGTTHQVREWIIVWEILYDGMKKTPEDTETASELLITLGVEDPGNRKRIVPSGRPYRAIYHLGTYQITPAWEAHTDHDGHRIPTYYRGLDPASNGVDVMRESYLKELANLEDVTLDATYAQLLAARAQVDGLTATRDRLIREALAAGESASELAKRYGVARSAIYQMQTRAQAKGK